MKLTRDQQLVFNVIIQNQQKTHLIAAFAGAGKTVTAAELAIYFIRNHKRVCIAATTNKAVKVLRESMSVDLGGAGSDFKTIHSLLGFRVAEGEDGNAWLTHTGKSSTDYFNVIIVDEVSMLERKVYLKLEELKKDHTIIFLGDIFQLSPIADNKPSRAFYDCDFKHALTKIMRQEKGNPVIKMSMIIRDHIRKGTMVSLEDLNGIVKGRGYIANSAINLRNKGVDVRILAYTNKCVLNYNRLIHERLHGKTRYPFSVGELILIRDGSIDFDLSVGDEYIIESIVQEEKMGYESMVMEISDEEDGIKLIHVCLEFDRLQKDINEAFSDWKEYKAQKMYNEASWASNHGWALRKAFANIRHIYAQTIHSSQGSTLEAVLIDYKDVCKKGGPERNRLFYVGISRTRDKFRVIG